ncbi:MAG: ATP synthase subunit C [Gammaproteobacteria bacterium]|nr:ATP synthase subunit C [Gammaproteobacteria bacterium]
MKPQAKLALVLTLGAGVLATVGTAVLWLPGALADESSQVAAALDPGIWRWGFMAAALAAGLSAIGAAYAVARVGSAAMGALAEKPELFGRLLIFVGLAEGIAIYGLIISILILNRLV